MTRTDSSNRKTRRLAVLGASGHGKVIADMAIQLGWEQVVFFDDAWPEKQLNGIWHVVGDTEALFEQLADFDGVIVGIGNNAIRLNKQAALANAGANLVSLVHPAAVVSRLASLGKGSVVMAGAVVQVDVHLGEACIINTRASVDHDCRLGDGVHVSPGANLAGGVVVGEGSWVGIGASIRQLVHLGSGVVIGANGTVVSHVSDGLTMVGTPARPLHSGPPAAIRHQPSGGTALLTQ
ncbi:acetyltransferase [Halomonas sp. ZH2S]|uniref:Acetyltransferase n=1 Tax=Vreelandella zhuhanensis TaxID=2684210 RepID=A0A7X3KR41_9GAMM|nr:acetyltransferase [Halomonas zhuhanensis]MWJ28498.1 acetyltransferase [Halomonas zhuhanensis]